MIAKREVWNYPKEVSVWVGKYKNSHNLLHWHYDCELLYVERGSIDVFCEKKTHHLVSGELLYIDSGQVHYMRACDPETILIVIIFNNDILKSYIGNLKLATPKLTEHYPIPQIYKEVRDILLEKNAFFGGEAAVRIISLMLTIFRSEKLVTRHNTDKTTERFMLLLDHISENMEYFTFEEAVSFMAMSDAYFSRYFRQATGITFSQYLNIVRIERAIELIKENGNRSVTEIAEICGFGTIRNFNRIFKQLTGYSPTSIPEGYAFSEKFTYPSDSTFNPTLHDCELIESGQVAP